MTQGLYKWSKTASSNASADSSINWAEGQAPSTINDSARAVMARVAEYRDDTAGSLTTSGSSTAYTLTTNQVFDSLADLDGRELSVTFHTTSGASPTLAVDSLTAKPINVSTATAVGTGVILANSVWPVVYNNSSGVFLLKSVPASVQDGTVNTNSVAASAITYAKIQNVAGSRLLGNPTGSSAAPSEISLGTGLSFSSSTIIATLAPGSIPNFISGLTLSTAGSSNSFGIAAGVANDSTNASLMSLGSAYTKTTSSWAVGTGNGGLDTGAIAASTWYHVYIIQRTDTGVVDVIFSLSASAPTYPTSYTLSRRIGSMKTDGSNHWVQFTQFYDYFYWTTGVNDSTSLPSSSDTLYTLASVPTGVRVIPFLQIGTGSAVTEQAVRVRSPDLNSSETSIATTNGLATFGITANGSTATRVAWSNMPLITNTSAQVSIINDSGVTATGFTLRTEGWLDFRGKA